MKVSRSMSLLVFFIAGAVIAQDAKATPLMSKDLAQFPGKEGEMITVVYPRPHDVHTVGRNASRTKPAKFVVFLVRDKGAPVLVPVNATSAGGSASPGLDSGRR